MTHPPDVVCAGIVVADFFCDPVDHLPVAGSLDLVDDILPAAGGCAVNVAVSLAKLGLTVAVAGRVGRDIFGDFICDYLAARGVETGALVRSDSASTSKTVILNVRGEDRRYLHCTGANAEFSARDVTPAIQRDARALYVGGYLALPKLSRGELAALFQEAAGMGMRPTLDVVIPNLQPRSLDEIQPVMPWVDMFLPNDDEARCLTGISDRVGQARTLARLAERGTVVVTCGPAGAVAADRDGVLTVGTYPVEMVDPSGAGDAFAAGMIAGQLEGWPLEVTLKFASALGASAVRNKGCTDGVFTRQEALEFVSSRPIRPSEIEV